MKLCKVLGLLASLQPVISESIIDFSAARGDSPSMLGTENLQTDRDKTITADPDDLFIKLGNDPDGTPALHFHRIKDYIRAEYHALPGKIEADQTYYIGYKFQLGAIEQDLMVFQFKAYSGNDEDGGNANIPLSLEFKSGKLNFQYQNGYSGKRESQWSTTLSTGTVYTFGIVINTSDSGWAELYFNGDKQTFATSGSTRLSANTFLGRNEPKFGVYRGEDVGIDSYVYNIQIGTELSDITEAAGLGSDSGSGSDPEPSCAWDGHCEGATCSDENDCSGELVCKSGICSSGSAPSCDWPGHCAGADCNDENDCFGSLACKDGSCASE
ncbi:hypothetical protein FE257_001809 [Aspergillus nanangensis]|uniref:Uncharacterized protein n=1 Tax=Aspergillus nanangensis TaxID=2582783 RepID=A0AAD4CDD9_ASPNN|nr:hypothetical protein FE257_001809 [Aspergillus nanangensis]